MKTNLYAIPMNNQKWGEWQYLTKNRCYKVWKILNLPEMQVMQVVLVDDRGYLGIWNASLFTFKEIED